MEIDIFQTIIGGLTSSIAWFIVGSILYMNPLIAKTYKKAKESPALKKWPSVPKYVVLQYIGILAQCLLWAFIFTFIKPALPEGFLAAGFAFGFLLVAIKIFPRLYDMWIQSTYPKKLLAIEFVNGAIGSFIIGLVLAYII